MSFPAFEISALCGSLRRVSMNARLLGAATRLAPQGVRIRMFDGLGDLPLFNPDLDAEGLAPPAPVRRLREVVVASDAMLIASPEYAHGITAVLKNALDWLVSFEGFVGKPVAIYNASPRSVHAHASLREILTTMSARLIDCACLELPLRGLNLTEEQMVASVHAAGIRAALAQLVAEVRA